MIVRRSLPGEVLFITIEYIKQVIHHSLKLIQKELSDYLSARGIGGNAGDEVVLGNIALFESEESTDLQDSIVITLVNIEEERTLKNARAHRPNSFLGKTEYKNPPVSLNLYVLFSAYYTSGSEAYEKALQRLSSVIEFFQSKSVFSLQSSSSSLTEEDLQNTQVNNLKLIFNIYTMTFEQLNHLWGALGGKQVPSVMFRAWLVQLEDEKILKEGTLIEEIQSKEEIR